MILNDIEIGKKIKQYRKGKMTQQELAEKIGRTESSIRKYEKGLVTIPLDVLEMIAAALGITAFDLMGFEYFDKKYPDVSKEQSEYEALLSYIKSLGYNIEITSIPLKCHKEETYDSDGNVIGVSTIVDEETVEYNITGNNISVILSEEDFARLKTSSADLISSFLWKKSQDNKK